MFIVRAGNCYSCGQLLKAIYEQHNYYKNAQKQSIHNKRAMHKGNEK